MADESDVETVLAAAVTQALYPSGTSFPPVGGNPCRIARGDPSSAALDADLTAGIVNVRVMVVPMMTRRTTRYFNMPTQTVQFPVTLAVSLMGAVATFSGVGGAGNIVAVTSRGLPYTYVTVAADTPSSVAAALAGEIPGATAAGAALTLPASGAAPAVGIVGQASVITELRRQEQGFSVCVLAPTPDARSAVASAVDAYLAAVDFLALADGSGGRLLYRRTKTNDVPSKANLWIRDLLYTVEYGTTLTQTVSEMAQGRLVTPALSRSVSSPATGPNPITAAIGAATE